MKIVCSKSDLIEAVSVVSRVVKGSINLPILTNILIDASGEKVILRGYDMETGIECSVEGVDIQENGRVAVSAKMLGDISKKMSEDTLTLVTEDNSLVVRSGKSKMKMSCSSAEDFPLFPTVDDPQSVTIKSNLLKNAFSKVLFAVSKDNTRAVLTGVYLRCKDGILKAVAIDGFRMAIINAPVENSYDFGVIIPAKTVSEILRLIGSDDESDTLITLGKTQAYFDVNGIKVVSRMISGNYIDYEKIIVRSCKTKLTVGVGDFYDAIDRACLVANSESTRLPATVTIKDGGMTIDCSGSSSSTQDIINDIEVVGDDVSVDLNAFYLNDVLRNIDDDSVNVEFSGESGPIIFKPLENEDYLYLVLPIRR